MAFVTYIEHWEIVGMHTKAKNAEKEDISEMAANIHLPKMKPPNERHTCILRTSLSPDSYISTCSCHGYVLPPMSLL